MDEPYLRLENLNATHDEFTKSVLLSEAYHLYLMFFQQGGEKPEVALMVNFHQPISTPNGAEFLGCVIGISPQPAANMATDLRFLVVGDFKRIRGAQVAFQFSLMPAYTGSSRLTIVELLNILRGSLDGLPGEHHTDLTRFEFKRDNSTFGWDKRGGRDVITQWMVRLFECGFINRTSVGQGIETELVNFNDLVRTNNFEDIIGHVYTNGGYDGANRKVCKVAVLPIARGNFREESVMRAENSGSILLPYDQTQ